MSNRNGGRFGDERRKQREALQQHHGRLKGALKFLRRRLGGGR